MNTQNSRTDPFLAERVEHALWEDDILRHTDYPEISVNVTDGVASLNGHVTGAAYEWRADAAARTVTGIRDVKSYLVRDDEILILAAGALGRIERLYDVKFFTGVRNGVVSLNGKVSDEKVRLLAEQCVAEIPGVRGVINHVHSSEANSAAEDTRFLQPVVGEKIYSRDGLSGVVHKVVINPSNRRVVAMIVRGQYAALQKDAGLPAYSEDAQAKQLIVIPMSAIRFLTKVSGFLHVDGADASLFDEFDPAHFAAPGEQWTPPYPYRAADILFSSDGAVNAGSQPASPSSDRPGADFPAA